MWRYLVEKYELTKTENHETANRVLNKLYWILFAAYGVINERRTAHSQTARPRFRHHL